MIGSKEYSEERRYCRIMRSLSDSPKIFLSAILLSFPFHPPDLQLAASADGLGALSSPHRLIRGTKSRSFEPR